jgi:transposase
LLIATALVAFIGDIRRFPSGRHFASYLGLTPREYSSGLKRNLGRISKRGDGYLRTLLIHGARSVLVHARKQQPDRLREWANNLAKTHVLPRLPVAVANKLPASLGPSGITSAPSLSYQSPPDQRRMHLSPRSRGE